MKNISALICGFLFGLGLAISEMVNPSKVLGFLDVTGNWDPSLIFVMAAGLAVTLLSFRFILKQPKPLFEHEFHLPSQGKTIDRQLMTGATIFGIGWGLVGYCPGPAIASLAYGQTESVVFLVAMMAGLYGSRRFRRSAAHS